jgi:putative membrane protein
MRFSTLALAAAIVAAASFSACKSTTAQGDTSMGGSGSMSADGGMGSATMSADGGTSGSMSADGGGSSMGSTMGAAASDMGAAAGQAGHDMKAGAQAAGHDMAAAGSMAADAGMQAASSAGTSMKDAAGSAATTATGATTGAAAGATADTSAKASMTDAQFAAWAVAANTSEVDAGKYAEKHAKNAKVKAFAKEMVKDHGKANKEAMALAKKASMTPEETDASKGVTSMSSQNLESMKSLKGAEFDKAYVDAQVSAHQMVLDTMDANIPNLQNADLKALATKHRAAVAKHLEHAKTLQSSMADAK